MQHFSDTGNEPELIAPKSGEKKILIVVQSRLAAHWELPGGLFMTRRLAHLACGVVASAFFLVPAAKAGPTSIRVRAGYDLLQTDSSNTTFPGLGNLMGVPVGSYNFGGSVGTVDTGQTDTIVQRLADAVTSSLPGTAPTIADQIDALDLETVAPVNFSGLGVDNYFLTLQSTHGGPLSTGTMDISFTDANGGMFNSSFDVFYDIRKGSLSGPIVGSSDSVISGSGMAWNRTAPPGAILIDSDQQPARCSA